MNNEEAVAAIKTEKQCVLDNIAGCDRNCGACALALKDNEILSAYDKAISALERSDKYRWHDLRKNPQDLPAKEDMYFIAYFWDDDDRVNYYFENFVCGMFLVPDEATVIAWREIEQFEEDACAE